MDAKCSHAKCNCTDTRYEREGQRFCSAACAGDAQTSLADAMCGCAHAGCGGK